MSQTVVFVGDGLTAGGRWNEWLPEYEVRNLGVSGYTTEEVVASLPEIVATAPDAVVLQVGTNDLGWRRSDEYIVRNLETIIVELRKHLPATRILVVSVPPRERDYCHLLRSINRHLRQFAPTQHAQFLDLWPSMAEPDGELAIALTTDRLHLTDDGYATWVAELKPALEFLFQRPPSSTAIPIQHV
ncbi:lysophospholipase L1-like esterase [Cryobacterium sp. MP_M5]|uniref:GDSL-type esterase/lipase family protein n=1 Tax=unclassified Cryobacterium TaxID=2649013 RepID=UPI0018C95882|nr:MULTISPECIES: GDSL-type esterase/lipase family protein [unclassified Cryobacterium]MBG6057349.1 lysophospholipase L1-like esterase [Cryobacterium sp. MP_M3]MEC5175548.1 lysophospholipase L1-like esterase [Cryobacterium sp. MP_M5]